MSSSWSSWVALIGTVVFTVYGQLVLKWQMSKAGELPSGFVDATSFVLRQVANPWILSGFVAAGIAAFCWLAALTRFELGIAYMFAMSSFVLVVLLSIPMFGETMSIAKAAAVTCICAGLLLGSQHG